MNKVTMHSLVSHTDDILTCDIDEEKVMMSIDKGQYFGLDPIGSRIWEMLETPQKVSDIIATLLDHYDVDGPTCKRDTLAFLHMLSEKGLLRIE